MRIFELPNPRLLAAICFGMAAAGALGSWAILLFVARPSGTTPVQAALSQLQFTFSIQSEQRLWFVGWALLPLLLSALCLAHAITSSFKEKWGKRLLLSSAAVALFSLLFWPEVALLAFIGTYCSYAAFRDA